MEMANYTILGGVKTTLVSLVHIGTNGSNQTTTGPSLTEPNSDYEYEHRDLHEEIALLEFVAIGLVQTILCFAGFLLNTVSSIVWWKDGARNVTIYLLRVLSIVDNSFLLFNLLYHSMPSIYAYLHILPDHFSTLMRALPYTWPLLWTTKTMAVWCIVIMSIIRYNIVCNPLKTSVRLSTKRVTQYLAALFLGLILVNIPRWFEIQTSEQTNPSTNQTEPIPDMTPMARGRNYQIAYTFIFTITMTYILPMSILLYCSIRLIRILKKADTYRKTIVFNSVQISHGVTKMLLTVIVLFVICETPEFIYSAIYLIATVDPTGPVGLAVINGQYHIRVLKAIGDLTFTVNSSCNFFIYLLMARKFRKLVSEILFCKKPKTPRRSFSTSTSTQRTLSVSCNSSVGNVSIAMESPRPPRHSPILTEREIRLDANGSDQQVAPHYRGQTKQRLPHSSESLSPNSIGYGNSDTNHRKSRIRDNGPEDNYEMGFLVN